MAAAANVDQLQFRRQRNRRGLEETIFWGHHNLTDLRNRAEGLNHGYLFNEPIPQYPQPEFSGSRLRHDTDRDGLRGICKDKGFKNPFSSPLVWWSLDIGHHEINSAAKMPMMTNPPGRLVEMEPDDLEKFATSPAFQESSRLGPYRFTLPLEKVLQRYKEQFCDDKQPRMRAFRTYLYKQEVMYVVLVHRPCDEELFVDYPLLTGTPDPVCAYRDGCIIWRAQAMCNTHGWTLVERPNEQLVETVQVSPKYYVWDHVSVALYVGDQVLKFDDNDLCNSLKLCNKGYPIFGEPFDEPEERDRLVKELWPNCPALQKPAEVEAMVELLETLSFKASNA